MITPVRPNAFILTVCISEEPPFTGYNFALLGRLCQQLHFEISAGVQNCYRPIKSALRIQVD